MPINVTRSALPPFEEYCAEIRSLWESHWLTNNGEKLLALEARLRGVLDVPHVALFTNGHLALEALLSTLPAGGEVLTTPYTFTSTTHAIVRKGLVPVFCDINDVDYTLDPCELEKKLTPRTCAVLPVHVYGNLCDVDAIARFAGAHGLRVFYDAAHAFGVTRDGVSAARFGDASMFSFHATKVFQTIEGGAIVCQDAALNEALELERNYGITGPEDVITVGGNAKMSEFQAAMGLCNLRHLDEEYARRRHVYEQYHALLGSVPGIRLCSPQKGVTPNYAYFPVVFDGYRKTRDKVFHELAREGIHARKYFYPLTNDYACYRGRPGFDPAQTPVARRVADHVLTLPLYGELSELDVERICRGILA